MRSKEVFGLLFKDSEYIDHFPFERKYLMRNVRETLTAAMSLACYMDGWNSTVKTKNGKLDFDLYLKRFTKNLFDCMESCARYRNNNFDPDSDIPNKVYHGTSTKVLPVIGRFGLLPSKAGQCWEEDKVKKPKRVCLTDSLYGAEFYALNSVEEIGGEPMVFTFNIRGITKDQIGLERFVNGSPTPFDLCKEVCFYNRIPPNRIRNWYFVPEKSGFTLLGSLKPAKNT